MNPETGSFTSMDTWQGDLYEPVTLHKYLYANANPVKYKDPSGMFSLPECNIASAIGAELYQNQNVILGMSLLNGIGKSVMTGLCGGDAGDMTEAFLEGMIEGAAMGMLFCAVAAVLATSMLTVMMAHTAASSVVSIVLAIYRVSEGDYLNALVYGAVAVARIISVAQWLGMSYQIKVNGKRGIAIFEGVDDTCTNTVWDNITPTQSNIPGTQIPKSFRITTNGESFWVHPNGTKHMGEYVTRNPISHGMPMKSQGILASFESAVDTAVAQGVRYENVMKVGNWELVFSQPKSEGLLSVIKHALYIP